MNVQFRFTVGCHSKNRVKQQQSFLRLPLVTESSRSQFSWYNGGAPVKEDKIEKGTGRDLSQAMGR